MTHAASPLSDRVPSPAGLPARRPHRRHRAALPGLLLAWGLLAGGVPMAQAADTPSPAAKADDKLAAARAQVAAKRWPDALAELRKLNDTGSADWHNLMGYVLRKGSPPDLDGADRHYREALRIDPRHRGALEYSGELALMRGDLAGAEQKLAALDRVCLFGCEEYTDLKAAVQRFKAAGNRWQPGA